MAAHKFCFEWSAFVACSRGATAVQYLVTVGLVALTGSVAFGEFGDAIRHGVRAEMLATAESSGEQTDGPTGSLAAEVATAGAEVAVVQGSWALAAKAGTLGLAAARRKQRGRAASGAENGPPSGSDQRDPSPSPGDTPRGDPSSGSEQRDGASGSGVCRNGVCTPGDDGSNCFAAGTAVDTPRGPTPIERLAPGDLVLSRDDVTGNFSAQRVSATFVAANSAVIDVRTVSFSGVLATVRVTPGHPFWTPTGTWVRADALLPGDILADHDGAEVRVARVDAVAEPATTYNLEVEGTHTYFAGPTSVWVHNGCWPSGNPIKNPFKKKPPAVPASVAAPAPAPAPVDPVPASIHPPPAPIHPSPAPAPVAAVPPPASIHPPPAPIHPSPAPAPVAAVPPPAPVHAAPIAAAPPPRNGPKTEVVKEYKTAVMTEEQVQQDIAANVIPLTSKQLEQRRVIVQDGKLRDPDGNRIAAAGMGPLEYVMDTKGNIYIAEPHSGIFNHSQFLGKDPVAGAGMITVDADGNVVEIDNKSGHYKPDPALTQQVVDALEKDGAKMPKPTVHAPPPVNVPPPPRGGPPRGGPPANQPAPGGAPPAVAAPRRGKKPRVYAPPNPSDPGPSGTAP